MANLEVAYDGYVDETILLDFSYIDNDSQNLRIRQSNNIFNRIREIEIDIDDVKIDSKIEIEDNIINDTEFKNYYKNNFSIELDDLLSLEYRLSDVVRRISSKDKEIHDDLIKYNTKLSKLKKILGVSFDIFVGEDECDNDQDFFKEYKSRITTAINQCNYNIKRLSTLIKYNYNIFNIVRKLCEKDDIVFKYKCMICHYNDKDSFLDCGHTYCKKCIDKLNNLLCPYCNVKSKKVNRLYLN